MSRWLALAWLVALTTIVQPLRAEVVTTVLLFDSQDSPFTERLTREFEQANIAVRRGAGEGTQSEIPWLVVVGPAPVEAVEVWSGPEGERRLAANLLRNGESDDALALRVTELVRALSIPTAKKPDSPAPAPPAPETDGPSPKPARPMSAELAAVVVNPLPPERTAAGFDFALAAALGMQSPGVSLQIEGTALAWPHEVLGVGAFVSVPVLPAEITETEGSAEVRSALVGVELATAPTGRKGDFAVLLDPGLALHYLHVAGASDRTPEASLTGDELLLTPYGRAELRARVAGPMSIRLGALGGVALPAVDIRFAGRAVTRFSPVGSLSLGLMVEP